MRYTPVRCTPVRCTLYEMDVHMRRLKDIWPHAHEVHAHEVYAHEVHVCEIHVYEVHTHEVHAHEAHAIRYTHEVHRAIPAGQACTSRWTAFRYERPDLTIDGAVCRIPV
jgi:hypothetical protein